MRGAVSTMRRSASAPARWPSKRGSPRAKAQRTLPSMIIATCRELCFIKYMGKFFLSVSRSANQRFHVCEIAFERGAATRGEPVFRAGHAAFEVLFDGDVAGVFQLAGVDAEIAVGGFEQLLEFGEGQNVVDRERAHDGEAQALMDDAVARSGAATGHAVNAGELGFGKMFARRGC